MRFQCGVSDKIIKVEEPERCVYDMLFETAAVCEEAEEQDILDQLKKLE